MYLLVKPINISRLIQIDLKINNVLKLYENSERVSADSHYT